LSVKKALQKGLTQDATTLYTSDYLRGFFVG